MTARTAADLAGINKTTAAYFYHRLREIIAWRLAKAGEIEADESYFGGKRKGKWQHDQTTEYTLTALPNCPTKWDHLNQSHLF